MTKQPQFSRIDYKEIGIDFIEESGTLAYTFAYEGNNYGNKVILKSKKRIELLEASCALFINAVNTYEELCKK